MKSFLMAAPLSIFLLPSAVSSQTKLVDSPGWYAIKTTIPGNVSSCTPIYKPYSKQPRRMSVSPFMRIDGETAFPEQVTTILVSASPENDDWVIRVSVVFGDLYSHGKKRIATRRIPVGESTSIEELAQFGIRPFEVSIVAMGPATAVQPDVTNSLAAIEVVDVQLGIVPRPHVITLKNLSSIDVQSLEFGTYTGSALHALATPRGTWDRPLLKAHSTGQVSFPSNLGPNSNHDPCVPAQSQSIEFRSVVFADKSHEGNPFWAASYSAVVVGNRLQIESVLNLIQHALATTSPDSPLKVSRFKESALALDEKVPAGSLQGLNAAFPSLDDPESGLVGHARAGMDEAKCDLLEDLAKFERDEKEKPAGSFTEWLQKEKEKYERWRSKLQ